MKHHRISWKCSAAILASLCLLLLGSCFDPEPARVSIACTFEGLQRSCDIVLESPDGRIQQRQATNIRGIGEFQYLVPGEYYLRFVDAKDKAWPAMRYISLRSGETISIRVELSESIDPRYAPPAA